MLFRLLRIRKAAKEIHQDAGGFAAGEVAETVVAGFLLIPGIISVLALAAFFILGYTNILGGPMGFFRFLFVLALAVFAIFLVLARSIVRLLKRGTRSTVNAGVQGARSVYNELQDKKVPDER